MNIILKYITGIALAVSLIGFTSCERRTGTVMPRKTGFDRGWLFHYGDTVSIFNDKPDEAGWKKICLPHDWSIEPGFSKNSEGGKATGFTVGGTGWYVKKFTLSKDQHGKLLSLYFEGVYMKAEIWLNGEKIGFHPYGYTSFFCDITDKCLPPGKENTLAVKVVNRGKNSRWYSGSGIYRHVWMITTDKLHLGTWGVYVTTPEIRDEKAVINISANLLNETDIAETALLEFRVSGQSGEIAGKATVSVSIKPGETRTVVQRVDIAKPAVWSVGSPTLYTASVIVKTGGKVKDRMDTDFGIRAIAYSAEEGFLVNGKPVKLKGGCLHHDNGLLGAAAIDRSEERKAELLKANGFNAVRCAHNPPSEKFLEACDRLGILVIDEAFDQWQKEKNPDDYHCFFDQYYVEDFTSMLLRDRNHPSIIMWSTGNEIQERADTSGLRIEMKFRELVDKYDPTRPITLAVNDFWDNPGYTWKDSERAFGQLDICGYNYLWWFYESDHREFPGRIIYGSESTAMERAINWELVEKNPYIIGDFVWTAMDYLGETGIGHTSYVEKLVKGPHELLDYPCFSAWCGDIDLCGDKKPQATLRDVMWDNSKIEMLVHQPVPAGMVEKVSYWGWPDELASWTWKGMEGKILNIRVFTRYPSVRLYLNNTILEEKQISKDTTSRYIALFQVKYQQGTLKAVGMENGTEKDSTLLVTTGEPAEAVMKADRLTLENTGNDLSYVQISLVDKDGRLVMDEDRKVELAISGAGEIAAAGNASPTDMVSFRSMSPKTFHGRALAIIRPTGKGIIVLTVRPEGLPEETIKLTVKDL